MRSLFFKEINVFLNSLIGYIAIGVFLVVLSLFMWIFPGDNNVFSMGYANIDTLFILAPWVFMFLIPAITMRSFADEKKTGTIELLITKPLTDLQIVLAKYFAGMVLVVIALIPTLIYYYSVSSLGNPAGNIDTGAMWGSYFGLLFLASGFVAIGIFASSITENQIIAFIAAVFISFIFFLGFDSLAAIEMFDKIDSLILWIGMNEHYVSMSRGVIDTRDLVYFLSLSALWRVGSGRKIHHRNRENIEFNIKKRAFKFNLKCSFILISLLSNWLIFKLS